MNKFILVIATLVAASALAQAAETVTDICGNTYPVVTIGTQTWMAENMKCDKYDTESEAYNASWLTNNTLPTSDESVYAPYFTDATDNTKWSSADLSGTLSNEQIAKLGYLYNWAAAVGLENGQTQTTEFIGYRQGICPNGWHVPSRAEWQTLYDYIYQDQQLSDNKVGKYLKTTVGWYNGDEYYKPGTDSYDFAALPAGSARGSRINGIGHDTNFWTSLQYEIGSDAAYGRLLYYYNDNLYDRFYSEKNYGYSVRCLKNSDVMVTPAKKKTSWFGDNFEILIESKSSWTITVDKKWVSVSKLSGSGNETLSVNVGGWDEIAKYDTAYISIKSITGYMDTVEIIRIGKTPPEKCKASDYPQVTIGTQTWMAENYRCSKYDTESEAYNASWLSNNTIPTSKSYDYTPYYTDATNKIKWASEQYAGNLSTEQISKLGYLYNWAATVGVADGEQQTLSFYSTRQGICPNGWHVPSKEEWSMLYEFIKFDQSIISGGVDNFLRTTSGWYDESNQTKYPQGLDVYGFAALPSGDASVNIVGNVGSSTYFWSATPNQNNNHNAFSKEIYYSGTGFSFIDNKDSGRSVRCVKSADPTAVTETEAEAATAAYKALENGQIVIVKGDKKYNLQGVEIK